EWVHVQLHQQKGMISLSPPTICNSAGLAAARAQGRLGGRPRAINKHEQEQISRLLEKGHPRQQLAIIFGIGVSTLYRYFPASRIKKRMN
ncbi:helix-turn-helix domain-containing protein, partial [Salmonella enterica subsp. enterica serovar 1,4,[5],12:i:-]